MKLKLSKPEITFVLTLAIFGTALAPFIGEDQRNYLVIVYCVLIAPLVLVKRCRLTWTLLWAAAAVAYAFAATLLNDGTAALTTVAYTTLFVMGYLVIAFTLRSGHISRPVVTKTLCALIFLYAGMSVLQLACSFVGLPVPNLVQSKGLWSYNSLAVEPSHAARVLSMSMLAYLILMRGDSHPGGLLTLLRDHKAVIAAFLLSIALTGSALAAIAAPLALLLPLSRRWVVLSALALLLCWPSLYLIDFEPVQRGLRFVSALPTMDIRSIVEADHSGSLRVMPLLIFLQKASLEQPSIWFGAGLESIRPFMEGELIGTDHSSAGLIPGYIIAFGFVGFAIFLYAFVLRHLSTATLPLIVLWLALFGTSAWNVQLFWFGLMLIPTVRYLGASRPAEADARASERHVLVAQGVPIRRSA